MGLSKRLREITPGLRMIKTVAALIICFVISELCSFVDATTAAIACIVCLQQNINNTWRNSINRAIGTSIAGVYAFVFLRLFVHVCRLDPERIFYHVLVAIAVIPLMKFLLMIKKPGSITIACIVFVLICISSERENALSYTASRVLDTLIGIAAALLMDWMPPLNRLGERLLPRA